jgi:chorismate synthase
MFGSQHNDIFALDENGNPTTLTNNAGGVLGGMTTSRPVEFRVAFKPTATIAKEQKTLSKELKETTIIGKGRHDPCVLPRAVPIVEAMSALVCADALLIQRTTRV